MIISFQSCFSSSTYRPSLCVFFQKPPLSDSISGPSPMRDRPNALSLAVAASLLVSCFGAPPRDIMMPAMQFDIYNIKTPQLIGIVAGTIVFSITIGVVIYLLYASGTLTGAWKEVVDDARNGKLSVSFGQPALTRLTSPFAQQPELYDYLLNAKRTLNRKLSLGPIDGPRVTIRPLCENDMQWLYEASNGSPQYHESAYDLARVWGWHDVDITDPSVESSDKASVDSRKPWTSKEALIAFLKEAELDGVEHIIIEDKEYKKPIGLISLSNHSIRNLSVNIENLWVTPAFQEQERAHEAMFLLLDFFFKNGFRRITAEIDERHVIGKKFLQRCGFQFETILRKHKVIQNRNSNTALFVLLNSEWQDLMPKFKKYKVPEPIKPSMFAIQASE